MRRRTSLSLLVCAPSGPAVRAHVRLRGNVAAGRSLRHSRLLMHGLIGSIISYSQVWREITSRREKKRANSYWKVARLVGWMGKSSSFLSPDSSFRRPSFSTLIFFSIFVRFYSIRGQQDDRSWSGSGFPFSGGNFHPVCAARKWHRIWRGEWSDVYKTLARAVAYYTPLYPPSIPFLLGGTRIYYPHVIPVNHSFVSSPVYASSWATDVGWWTIAVPMKEFSLGSRRQQRKKKQQQTTTK